jgi:MFS family permease
VSSNSRRTSRALWIATLLVACYCLSYLDRQLISILVGPIKASLRLSDTKIGLLQGISFSLFYVAASLPLARIADQGNRTRLIAVCIVIWSFMTMFCGVATNFLLLLAARIGMASAEAGLPPAALTMMADMFDAKGLIRATSFFNVAPYIGGGIALLGGGALYGLTASWTMPALPIIGHIARWQLLFIIIGSSGFIMAAITFFVPNIQRRRGSIVNKNAFWEILLFVRQHPRVTVPYMLSIASMTMLMNANISWFPAAMIRLHNLDEKSIGLAFGPVYLVSGALGTLAGGIFIARNDLNIVERIFKFMRATAFALLAVVIIAPLSGSLAIDLGLMGVAFFLISSVLGLSSIPFQFIAPVHLRAQSIALLSMFSALIGIGLGPLTVGVLSDALSSARHPLSVALALVGAIVVPKIIVLLNVVLNAYRTPQRLDHGSLAPIHPKHRPYN